MFMLLVRLFVYHVCFLYFFSSNWCHELSAACDCGTLLTIYLTFFFFFFFLSVCIPYFIPLSCSLTWSSLEKTEDIRYK